MAGKPRKNSLTGLGFTTEQCMPISHDAQSLLSFLGPAFESFHDFAAINETLGEESLTVSVFEELDREHPESARHLFEIAKEALVRAKAYALCGRYLRPDEDWLAAAQLYQMTRQS